MVTASSSHSSGRPAPFQKRLLATVYWSRYAHDIISKGTSGRGNVVLYTILAAHLSAVRQHQLPFIPAEIWEEVVFSFLVAKDFEVTTAVVATIESVQAPARKRKKLKEKKRKKRKKRK